MIVIVCIATIIFVVGLIVVIIISNESYVYHLSSSVSSSSSSSRYPFGVTAETDSGLHRQRRYLAATLLSLLHNMCISSASEQPGGRL